MSFSPHDFEGASVIEGNGWSVVVDPKVAWPNYVEGKPVETLGMYQANSAGTQFTLVGGIWRLVRLEDQLGRKVELRGQARSLNDVWWFHYRGTDLYVENMANLPGWTPGNHFRPMVIRGTLARAKLPRIDQVAIKRDRDLKEYYIVRDASWEPLPALLSPERPIEDED